MTFRGRQLEEHLFLAFTIINETESLNSAVITSLTAIAVALVGAQRSVIACLQYQLGGASTCVFCMYIHICTYVGNYKAHRDPSKMRDLVEHIFG
jgi:hypothetical protein